MYKILIAIAKILVVPQNISRLSDTLYNDAIDKMVFKLGFGLTMVAIVVLAIVVMKIVKRIENKWGIKLWKTLQGLSMVWNSS